MLIDNKVARELQKARLESNLWFVCVSVIDILEEVRQHHFPGIGLQLEFLFVRKGHLACMTFTQQTATILTHQAVNRHDVPVEVLSLICKHELLHIEVPGRKVDGRWTSHPPEFREREAKIAPERSVAWEWIWDNLGYCLKVRPRLEGIDVTSNWRQTPLQRDFRSQPMSALARVFP